MKKGKLLLMLVLGVGLGWFGQGIIQQRQSMNEPLLDAGKLNIDGIISSITESISRDKIQFTDKKYERFDEVSEILVESFFEQEKLLSWEMIDAAVKAYVDDVDDPYTVYLDAIQQSWFDASLKGEEDFEWIGAVVRKKEYYVLIEEVLKESPAFKAGVKPLDRIVFVNTGAVKDLTITEAVNRIKGPKWTKVMLIIERFDRKDATKKEIVEIEVTRDKLIIPSVSTKILTWDAGKTLGYINISIIGEETEHILKREILKLKSKKIEGIVLDLRWNGGGFLPVAVQIASHFIPQWQLIVSAKYRRWDEEVYKSFGYGDLEEFPVVILINGMTASAGEIISMALQEQIGAKLIGDVTFGKGSIQTLDKFADGDSIKYTIGKRYAPSGKNIDHIGVSPDIEVEFDVDAYVEDAIDNQLEEAKDVLESMIK